MRTGLWGLLPKVFINPDKSLSIWSLLPLSTARGAILFGNHLFISLYQFLTRLLGHTTMALSMVGLQSGLCFSSVQRRVMHWRVFPRPCRTEMIIMWQNIDLDYHFIRHNTSVVPLDPGTCDTVVHELDSFSLMRSENSTKKRINHDCNFLVWLIGL